MDLFHILRIVPSLLWFELWDGSGWTGLGWIGLDWIGLIIR